MGPCARERHGRLADLLGSANALSERSLLELKTVLLGRDLFEQQLQRRLVLDALNSKRDLAACEGAQRADETVEVGGEGLAIDGNDHVAQLEGAAALGESVRRDVGHG